MIVRPAYHIFQFDMGLATKDPVYEQLKADIKKNNCDNSYNDFDMDIRSVKDLKNSGVCCATLNTHYYNDLYINNIPEKYENIDATESFIGKGSLSVRKYIRENWHRVGTYSPKYYTTWTYNPALLYPVDLYLCEDCFEN